MNGALKFDLAKPHRRFLSRLLGAFLVDYRSSLYSLKGVQYDMLEEEGVHVSMDSWSILEEWKQARKRWCINIFGCLFVEL